jgi:hypothetical protein
MMITSFDISNVKVLRDEIEAALAPLLVRHGLKLNINGVTYARNGGDMNIRLKFVTVNTVPESVNSVHVPGFTNEDMGKVFSMQGTQYRITGFNPRKPKNSVVLERIRDKKVFIAAPHDVLNCLNRQVASTTSVVEPITHISVSTHPGDWDKRVDETFDAYMKRTEDQLEVLSGKIIKFPVADGYAIYHVLSVSPVRLEHVPYGDAWQIPSAHIRGLTPVDIQRLLDKEANLHKLFGKK